MNPEMYTQTVIRENESRNKGNCFATATEPQSKDGNEICQIPTHSQAQRTDSLYREGSWLINLQPKSCKINARIRWKDATVVKG